MYILQRTNRPGYVSKPGRASSYTMNPAHAQKFLTREQAVANSCVENEMPVNLNDLLSALWT